ncbi:transglycosylase domain-containing protein [Actinomycetospora chiangmaiensis]|uniref:transglycosylase domain-containing protein n=1 Tax=Actinomycetospora chiangmaiensis TaxID=402650 RepID=UPI0006858D29|nr:transglycosylase domain-containing protein [Actinomycetospora chiangmaiensis]
MSRGAVPPSRPGTVGSLARLLGLLVLAGALVAAGLFPVVGGLGVLAARSSEGTAADTPGVLTGQLPDTTTVTDAAGTPIARLFDQDRQVVGSGAIAPAMKGAIVAIEDRQFFTEPALNPRSVGRALVNNSSGGSTQGASTLTQQYVKNYDQYVAARTPSERLRAGEATLGRKLREAESAVQLDRALSKDEILTRYLNLVSFGHELYGVATAARTYFHTTPDLLTVPQAALLAGMVQSPAADDPVQHPEAATRRRNVVLNQMRVQGMIDPATAAAATAAPLGVDPALPVPTQGCLGAGIAGFFCTYVLDYLDRAGVPPEQLRQGGYTIRTTMDHDATVAAKAAVDAQVPPGTPHAADVLATVLPGPTRHPVTALVANRGYGLDAAAHETTYALPSGPENLGAGSAYKIFTSSTYLAQGGGIQDVIPVPQPTYTSPLTPGYTIANAEPNPPTLTVQDALARSPNTAFVRLEESTGIAPVVDTAVRMGVRSLAESPGPGLPSPADTIKAQNQASFTLGPTPTSPLELANVGATLASHGIWCPPDPIASVTDARGRPVPLATEPCSAALPPAVADTEMTGLSKDDQPGGTSEPAAAATGWTRPTAAKTGTTNTAESGVFVAATPSLAGASVVFDDSPSPRPLCDGTPPTSCGEGTLAGGNVPARTFYTAATTMLAGQPALPLPAPDPDHLHGGARAAVPSQVSRSQADATAALQRAGYTVRAVPLASRVPAGTVAGQTPQGPGASPGEQITLYVSTGVPPALPPLPG